MIEPYDHEAFWAKAKVFLNRAMDPGPERAFDEQALWASAALELLGKAALARVSPLLIAEPTEDGANLLIATGLIEGTARFAAVSASTIFKRCHKAFRPFNADNALGFANARNEYLHGPSIGFMTLPPEAWWPRFWALAVILVAALDREIEELVGLDRVPIVEAYLRQNTKNVEDRAETLVTRAKQRLAQYQAGTLPARIQMEWRANPDLTAGIDYSSEADCPACGGVGTLEGSDDYDSDYESDWTEDGEPIAWATIHVPAEYFSCPTCHLVLDGSELIDHVGLPGTFDVIDDNPEFPEPDYGND
jgi:hypothetical protein